MVRPPLLTVLLSFVVYVAASVPGQTSAGLLPKWPRGAPAPVDLDPERMQTSQGPVVPTSNGPVRGAFRKSKKSVAWWGIPFAEPPIGKLRWRAPQPLQKTWHEPYEATDLSATCFDAEDCLYLNVYAPSEALASAALPRPVMFWIYGGCFVFGDGWEYGLYDGQHLSETHDVVVVSSNYRLGNLGFMALDALRLEDANRSTGNYGVQDQNLALKWVQMNIGGFGGDPGRVTIFGESAGAMSVMWHLVSPLSKGLFHAAIMESGTTAVTFFFQPYKDAARYHEDMASILKCPAEHGAAAQLACLRALPMHEIKHAGSLFSSGPAYHSPMYPVMPVGPVIDGTSSGLLDVPIRLVESGRFHKVPLIAGANEDGGSIFEPLVPVVVPHAKWPVTSFPQTLPLVFDHFFHDNASKAQAIYKTSEYSGAELPLDTLVSRLARDLVLMCPVRSLMSAWSQHQLPAFMYVFNFKYGVVGDKAWGDYHMAELPFVFHNGLWAVKATAPTSDAELMSRIMTCKWTSFAYTHDPNGGPDESKWPPNCSEVNRRYNNWPIYNLTQRQFYSLSDKPEVNRIRADNVFPDDPFPRDPKCDLLDSMTSYIQFVHDDGQTRLGNMSFVV